MPNHYHFLIELIIECDLSAIVKNFIISYTKAFNLRYKTVGHLFQGRFKCKLVETEEYLLTVARYIHNNPVKSHIVRFQDEWKYYSYAEYLWVRDKRIVSQARVMRHFRDINEFTMFSEGMLLKELRKMNDELYPKTLH